MRDGQIQRALISASRLGRPISADLPIIPSPVVGRLENTPATAIAAGDDVSFAFTSTHGLLSWGDSTSVLLGRKIDGEVPFHLPGPLEEGPLSDRHVDKVATAGQLAAALTPEGEVVTW